MKAAQQTSRQHVVSKVVLKEFAILKGGSGLQLRAFDLDHPERGTRLRPPSRCGYAMDFVAFDSASAEELWGRTEAQVPAALAAVRRGTPFADPAHAEVLRDLVVLHYVRSFHYRRVYERAFAKVRAEVGAQAAVRMPQQLKREALRKTGLHLTGTGPLAAFAERYVKRSEPVQDHESGKLFRISIENMFNKVQKRASTWRVEILTPAPGHEFLIGDNPGLTVGRDTFGRWTHGMAFDDATSVVLPVTPRCILALGPQNLTGTIAAAAVKDFNVRQVLAAERYIYMRPGSGLEDFAAKAAQERPARLGR